MQSLRLDPGRDCDLGERDGHVVLLGDAQDGVTRRFPAASTGRVKDFHGDLISRHERIIPTSVEKQGHAITEADLEVLRAIGESHIKILKLDADDVHKDDAAPPVGLSRVSAASK